MFPFQKKLNPFHKILTSPEKTSTSPKKCQSFRKNVHPSRNNYPPPPPLPKNVNHMSESVNSLPLSPPHFPSFPSSAFLHFSKKKI